MLKIGFSRLGYIFLNKNINKTTFWSKQGMMKVHGALRKWSTSFEESNRL
jgi:hypothetical protein